MNCDSHDYLRYFLQFPRKCNGNDNYKICSGVYLEVYDVILESSDYVNLTGHVSCARRGFAGIREVQFVYQRLEQDIST